MRKTKIVCTIGPACDSMNTLEALIDAGMNVARLNMSHADHGYHEKNIRNIRYLSEALDRPVGVLADLQGPKIRIGMLKESVMLEPGKTLTLTTRDVPGSAGEVNVPFKGLPSSVTPGQTILIDDGLIELKAEKVTDSDIVTEVIRGGELKERKGINLPHATIKIPSITEKDVGDLMFAIRNRVDLIAMSFVRSPEDVLELRKIMEDAGADIPIIAKIEKHEAVRNIDRIIDVVQGIMVARGDLGIEIPMSEVPIIQKMIISKCNARGIPVITATQMLDSMIRNPIPTRAEATDVANAVFDGTDALMLSGETAYGEYPVKAVEMMAKIARVTEDSTYYKKAIAAKTPVPAMSITDAVAFATTETARNLKAQAIITATETGYTARKVSKYKPQLPIFAVTHDVAVMNRLTLSWGVTPVRVGKTTEMGTMMEDAVNACLEKKYVDPGDLVIITAGILTGIPGSTNIMKVHLVSKVLARGTGIGKAAVKGTVHVVTTKEGFEGISEDSILVIREADVDMLSYIKKARAIITEEPGMTSYSAIIGREIGIPVIVGVRDATMLLKEGTKVTVDTIRGVIYEGFIKLPGE